MILTPFQFAADGWFQLCAYGDYPHADHGVVQRCDAEAFAGIMANFNAEAASPNFPGKLIDFEHGSFDATKPNTEAAGWIVELQVRPEGLFARPRWSDSGHAALAGGRYRFVSPVWMKSDCVEVEPKVLRPMRLYNAGLTNHANIRGMAPITNAQKNRNAVFNGIPLTIDRPIGYVHSGVDHEGKPWERTYTCDYGFIKKTDGGDMEDLDVFMLDNEDAPNAYWIVQQKPTGEFDEFKIVLGARDESEARKTYLAHVPEQFFQSIHSVPVASLHAMMKLKPKAVMDRFTPLPIPASIEPIVNRLVRAAADALLNRYYTKEQLAAIHAKGGFGGGGGRGGSNGGDTPAAPADIAGGPDKLYGSRTDWDAQIEATQEQREALMARRRTPTPPPDYSMTDLKKLQRETWQAHARGEISADDLRSTMDSAKASNDEKRQQLKSVRDAIKKKFPGDSAAQKAEFQKILDRQEREYQRATRDASKYNDWIDIQIAAKDREIANLTSNRDSELEGATQKSIMESVAAAARDVKARKVEADRAARRQAEEEARTQRALARAKKEAAEKVTEPSLQAAREFRAHKAYYTALESDNPEAAKRIFPNADHEANLARIRDARKSHSKDQLKLDLIKPPIMLVAAGAN
jgi:hypothetical protein